MRQLALLCGLLLTAVTCSVVDPTFPEPALIIFYDDTATVDVPDSVAAGVPFEVSVQTFAGGCTRKIARTEVEVSATLAEIRPYNETRRADVCTDDLLFLYHVVSLRFHDRGAATIRVLAEQRPFQGTGLRTGPAQLERHVLVH